MRKLTAFILAALLLLAPALPALAERADLTEWTDEDLLDLLDRVQREVRRRAVERRPAPAGDFLYGSNGAEVRINDYIGTEERVVIPVEIGSQAMGEGEVLVLPGALAAVGSQAFSGAGYDGVVIGSDAVFDHYAFESLNSLTFLYIREGCAPVLGRENFRSCRNLEVAVIPASVTRIAYNVFDGCSRLTIVTPAGSYAEAWAREHFFPVDTERCAEYAAEFEALYPRR